MVKTVLVTGAKGFVGRNLVTALQEHKMDYIAVGLDSPTELIEHGLQKAEIIYHLAGVNRSQEEADFERGNAGFTQEICNKILAIGHKPILVLASSIQAALDNPYGRSKRHAEEIATEFARSAGCPVVIYRFQNIFGKWCRPNYNSVVATFCHNAAHDLPLAISDPARTLELIYIDDVVRTLISLPETALPNGEATIKSVSPVYRITLGDLAAQIQQFREVRSSLYLPDLNNPLVQRLYSTYLTYLDNFAYDLTQHCDPRGALAEFIKSPSAGQIFVSRTKPGITRGNHYHHTKNEKFLVLTGEAVIRMRRIDSEDIIEFHVRGEDFKVVDIIPGYTHSITNIGQDDLITLFWASTPYDPANPDTIALPVLKETNAL